MLKNKAFKKNTERYDDWFNVNSNAYISELKAFKSLGISGRAIEIGVGTGKFAYPFGIKLGIEPTREMYEKAVKLGIDVIEARAEELPLLSDYFDWVTMVTTVCFVTDPEKSVNEMVRILRRSGRCAVGLVDKNSELGRRYLKKKDKNDFYREATFYSAKDIIEMLTKAGLINIRSVQTLTDPSLKEVEEPQEGHGKGGFVVISGQKP